MTRGCPICGRPITTLGSYGCTECGRVDFCERCVTTIPLRGTERFVCRTCITKKGLACTDCGDYAPTVCHVCSRRACQRHLDGLFALYVGQEREVHYAICPSCKGTLCSNCTQVKRGVFSTKVQCIRCGSELSLSPKQFLSCNFCGAALPSNSAFCPSCGRARI